MRNGEREWASIAVEEHSVTESETLGTGAGPRGRGLVVPLLLQPGGQHLVDKGDGIVEAQ
ncbi:hypothetical protein [Kitasatospora paranensis]|uniref:Uncharacterized protein n=1 Tax=Kitasatospora paranensis TaxID=258053 RepID=A0ABW2G3H6_9ACTN